MVVEGLMGLRKYRNEPTEIDGHKFPSKKEAKRFSELKLLERAGQITGLTLQPKFPLVVNGHKVCSYIGDFMYVQEPRGPATKIVIEDTKGYRTDAYRIKRKLFIALHPDKEHREI